MPAVERDELVGELLDDVAIQLMTRSGPLPQNPRMYLLSALRHRIADVKMQLELGRSMSYFASLKLNEPPEQRRRALAQAKLQLGNSMRFVGQQCVQLHGGIGVTDEYAGSHYFKRLTVLEMTFGDTMHHLGEVAARMQDTAGVFA